MNWKDELKYIENTNNWELGIELLKDVNTKNIEKYLRIMFLLLDFLVEGKYTKKEHDFIAKTLLDTYNKTSKQYSNSTEFLFFTGIMIYIGEWYFGMDNVDAGTQKLKKAMKLDPNNILFKWGYYSITDQRIDVNTDLKIELSEKILTKNSDYINWLISKGKMGIYVLGIIEGAYEELKKQSSSNL